jgi:anti-anti-sigma factor
MEIAESVIDGVPVLEPLGFVDSTNATAFTEQLLEVVRARQSNLIIDFQKVKYISSAGLRSLLIVTEAIEEIGKKLVLCGTATEVRRVLSITRLDELFVICSSREEALRVVR